MPEYLRPDVYVEREASGVAPIQSVGTATAGFVGVSPRGQVGVANFVSSWTEYVNKYARGLASPFIADSDLAYAVYGYFQNGGGRAYITRVASSTAKKATGSLGLEALTVSALDEGTWANTKLKVEVVTDGATEYRVIVKYDGVVVESYPKVVALATAENSVKNAINDVSKYITIDSVTTLEEGIVTLTGGVDGIADLVDADYIGDKGLKAFDPVNAITIVAIPGQTSSAVLQGIVDYCSTRKDCFAVLDCTSGLDTTGMIAEKATIAGEYGAIYHPWGKVVDPIGKGKLRLVPPSGHIAGIYARTDKTRGVHKAPAGVEAQVKGFVEVERPLSNGDIELLNPLGVNCIVAKPNQGIVVWGARVITPHLDRVYVSDTRLDINIEESLYEGTQWVVFEPNDEKLWARVTAQVKAMLYLRWVEGALFGSSPDEAFFVKCDAELNTQEMRDAGRLLVDVGYARKKPAEFTIFRLTQKTVGSN